MNLVSIIMPVYNVEAYVADAVDSVLKQTMPDFELLIIDDESPDHSIDICQSYDDPRIRIIHQKNLGLAGARNTGINLAKSQYIAFLDADDYWAPEKLAQHLDHLHANPHVGVSFCPSHFVDIYGKKLGIKQSPKLKNISLEDIFCRNPIGNGSAPVIRKAVFDDIHFYQHSHDELRKWYFDESFNQSEDIDCWLRIATETNWKFEGIPTALTYYRISNTSLSANVVNQFDSWRRAREHLQSNAPDTVLRWGSLAEAYQLRYLSRRAIHSRDSDMALKLISLALHTNYKIIVKEPIRTCNTLLCVILLSSLPNSLFCFIENTVMNSMGILNTLLDKNHQADTPT